MPTCRTCYFCIPYKGKSFGLFLWGTCYQAKRKVNANMTACTLHKERGVNVTIKSTPEKRNLYRDKDDNLIQGVILPEVLNKTVIIHAKREYTWGLYTGMAVKVEGENGKLGIVEITAATPIKALNMPDMPKPPYMAMFIEKTSKNKNKYYTIKVLDGKRPNGQEGENSEILPF